MKDMSKIQEVEGLLSEMKNLLKEASEVKSELLTSIETMKLLKISRNSYNRLKDEGMIKVYSMRGKLYCKRSEIMETIDNCRIN